MLLKDFNREKLVSDIEVFNDIIFISLDAEANKLGQNSLSNKTIFLTL